MPRDRVATVRVDKHNTHTRLTDNGPQKMGSILGEWESVFCTETITTKPQFRPCNENYNERGNSGDRQTNTGDLKHNNMTKQCLVCSIQVWPFDLYRS